MLGIPTTFLLVLSSPSGAGKTTLCRQIQVIEPQICPAISTTTRPKRSGEEEGHDYYFVDKSKFQRLIKEDYFLEHVKIFDHCYGTSKIELKNKLEAGYDVICDVNVDGARHIAKIWPGRAVRVFILPPSLEILAKRLQGRDTESKADIRKRLDKAEEEMEYWVDYDYVIVNDDIGDALEELASIVRAERLKVKRFHAYT